MVGKGSCRLLRDAVSITDKEEKIRVVEENVKEMPLPVSKTS